jgi:hypothetical protein
VKSYETCFGKKGKRGSRINVRSINTATGNFVLSIHNMPAKIYYQVKEAGSEASCPHTFSFDNTS